MVILKTGSLINAKNRGNQVGDCPNKECMPRAVLLPTYNPLINTSKRLQKKIVFRALLHV